jgi:carbonic anhydrase
MRLIEAIIDANQRALAGDETAGIHPSDYNDELPLVALTCVDPRLNALFPSVLGVPGDQFIWLRNAGNIVAGPMSSTIRSLALSLALKGGKEIAIIGHSDCLVGKITVMELIERFHAFGVERHMLPENLTDYFGVFGSARQNVIKAATTVRSSPLIGQKITVHGLLVDTQTGKLEWLVNGYEALQTMASTSLSAVSDTGQNSGPFKPLADFNSNVLKFSNAKIGEATAKVEDWVEQKVEEIEAKMGMQPPPPPPPPGPPKIPIPPPIRIRGPFRREK